MRYAVTQRASGGRGRTCLGVSVVIGCAVTTRPPARTKPPSARLSDHSQGGVAVEDRAGRGERGEDGRRGVHLEYTESRRPTQHGQARDMVGLGVGEEDAAHGGVARVGARPERGGRGELGADVG